MILQLSANWVPVIGLSSMRDSNSIFPKRGFHYMSLATCRIRLRDDIKKPVLRWKHCFMHLYGAAWSRAADCFASIQNRRGFYRYSANFSGSPVFYFNVPRGAFFPKPKIESSVFQLPVRKDLMARLHRVEWEKFFQFVDKGFSMRRKTLVNVLGRDGNKNNHIAALKELDIESHGPSWRPGALTNGLNCIKNHAHCKNIFGVRNNCLPGNSNNLLSSKSMACRIDAYPGHRKTAKDTNFTAFYFRQPAVMNTFDNVDTLKINQTIQDMKHVNWYHIGWRKAKLFNSRNNFSIYPGQRLRRTFYYPVSPWGSTGRPSFCQFTGDKSRALGRWTLDLWSGSVLFRSQWPFGQTVIFNFPRNRPKGHWDLKRLNPEPQSKVQRSRAPWLVSVNWTKDGRQSETPSGTPVINVLLNRCPGLNRKIVSVN